MKETRRRVGGQYQTIFPSFTAVDVLGENTLIHLRPNSSRRPAAALLLAAAVEPWARGTLAEAVVQDVVLVAAHDSH